MSARVLDLLASFAVPPASPPPSPCKTTTRYPHTACRHRSHSTCSTSTAPPTYLRLRIAPGLGLTRTHRDPQASTPPHMCTPATLHTSRSPQTPGSTHMHSLQHPGGDTRHRSPPGAIALGLRQAAWCAGEHCGASQCRRRAGNTHLATIRTPATASTQRSPCGASEGSTSAASTPYTARTPFSTEHVPQRASGPMTRPRVAAATVYVAYAQAGTDA